MSKITFTNEERTLLVLYLEDTKAQTEENISNMQKELTSAEKELFLLAEVVLEKLSSLTEEEYCSGCCRKNRKADYQCLYAGTALCFFCFGAFSAACFCIAFVIRAVRRVPAVIGIIPVILHFFSFT